MGELLGTTGLGRGPQRLDLLSDQIRRGATEVDGRPRLGKPAVRAQEAGKVRIVETVGLTQAR